MNNITISKKQLGWTIICTFIVAFLVGIGTTTAPKEATAKVKELEKKNAELQLRDIQFEQLKAIDDTTLIYCGEIITAMASGYEHVSNGDVSALETSVEDAQIASDKFTKQLETRNQAIRALGY